MMKRALLAVALLWSVCTASQAQDRAACERIVRLVAEAVGAGSIGEIEPFLAPGFIFSGQEGDRARAVMKLLVAQLGERVERIETVRQERTEEGLELVCAFTYAGRLGRKEATFLFDGEGRLKRLELPRSGSGRWATRAGRSQDRLPGSSIFRSAGSGIC